MPGFSAIGTAPVGVTASEPPVKRTISITLGNGRGAVAARGNLSVHLFSAPNLGAANITAADGTLTVDVTSLGMSGTVYASVFDPATGEHWTGPVVVA